MLSTIDSGKASATISSNARIFILSWTSCGNFFVSSNTTLFLAILSGFKAATILSCFDRLLWLCVLDAGSNEESGDLALFFFWDSLIKILYFWCSTGCCYKKFENICMIVTYGRHKVKLTSKCRTQLEGFLYWIFELYLQNLHVPCIHSSPSLRLSSLRTLSLAFGSIVNFAITSGVSLKKLKTPFSNHWGIFSCKPAILAMITIN